MNTSRRGFLQRATVIAGSILVTNPQVTGAELNPNGVLVPTQPEVLIATELPSKITRGNFEMYLTSMNLEYGMVDVSNMHGHIERVPSGMGAEVTIRGVVSGPVHGFQDDAMFLGRKKVKVYFTTE